MLHLKCVVRSLTFFSIVEVFEIVHCPRIYLYLTNKLMKVSEEAKIVSK